MKHLLKFMITGNKKGIKYLLTECQKVALNVNCDN